jgi:hypothetical protein
LEIKYLQNFQTFNFKTPFKKEIINYQAKVVEHSKVLIIFSIREQLVNKKINKEKEYPQIISRKMK